MAVLPQEPGQFLFHFWGTVWGELLTAVLIAQNISAETVNEYCLYTHQPLTQLPPIDNAILKKAARNIIITLANRLEMGRFHHLLPADTAAAATLHQLNLTQFNQLYNAAQLASNNHIQEQLHLLASGS